MTNRLPCVFVLVSLLLVCGCDSDDAPFVPSAALQTLADCTGLSTKEMVGVFNGLLDVVEFILTDPTGTPPPHVAFNETTGDYTVELDLDGNSTLETTLSGTIRDPAAVLDGIDINEAVVAEWSLAGLATGSGTFSFVRLTLTSFRVTIIEVNPELHGQGCDFEVTSFQLNFDILTIAQQGVSGIIEFVTAAGADDLSGLMTFGLGDDEAVVTGSFDGVPFKFYVDLDTYDVRF